MLNQMLKDTIFRFRYMLHILSPQEDSMRERGNIFERYVKAAQFSSFVHIFVAYMLNSLHMCLLCTKLVGSLIMFPFLEYL